MRDAGCFFFGLVEKNFRLMLERRIKSVAKRVAKRVANKVAKRVANKKRIQFILVELLKFLTILCKIR